MRGFAVFLLLTVPLFLPAQHATMHDALTSRVIVIDPGHGGTAATDQYRVGPTGEREEWVNLRVSLILRDMLEERGAVVVLTREEDVAVPLADRAEIAKANKADVFLSVHHNATADPTVNFPIVYYHGRASENAASVRLGQLLAEELTTHLFNGQATPPGLPKPYSVVSDHVIFPTAGAGVLRNSYGIPGVIGEASFFTNPVEELALKTEEHNVKEAAAYVFALEKFFAEEQAAIQRKETPPYAPFEAFQEADRMLPEARQWLANYEEGVQLLLEDPSDPEKALDRLTLSARSFPDSPVAGLAHFYRSMALDLLKRPEEATAERARVREHYPLGEAIKE